MTITMSEVRSHLDRDEVDYDEAAALGPQALPLLQELVAGDDPMLASKAAYLASLIPGEQQAQVLEMAARSADPLVRVAAASGLGNLDERNAESLADGLLGDDDLGVRKLAIRSVARFGSDPMAVRLRRVADNDPDETMRDLAAQQIGDRPA